MLSEDNKKNYRIHDATVFVRAKQIFLDKDTDGVEFITAGSYYCKNGTHYILYTELGEGMEQTKTTLKIENDNRVTVIRSGAQRHKIVFTRGERQRAFYETGFGSIMLGVSGTRIHSDLTEQGGKLKLEYLLDIDSAVASHNILEVEVKGKVKANSTADKLDV